MLAKLKNMFNHCTESQDIKDYAKKIMDKHNHKHYEKIKKEDNILNENTERDLDPKLKKWRLKERKIEFEEKINALTIKELLPKTIVQNKLKALDLYQSVLEQKDGDKEVEEKLGVKLNPKYFTLQYSDEKLPGAESPP